MVIRGTDRIADVLRRDPALTEVFIAASPVFEKLRNPLMRKTMARLTTVEQAAGVAGVDPALLVDRLNTALSGGSPVDGVSSASATSAAPPAEPVPVASGNGSAQVATVAEAAGMPAALASLAPDRIVDLDVREDLRNGREPFSIIMAARRTLEPGNVLRLRAIFEPVPLYVVMAKQGLEHWTEELGDEDWRVWFYPAELAAGAPAPEAASGSDSGAPEAIADEEDDVVVIDVRGMDPPEPMVLTLAALEELPAGKTLLHINERVPKFLLARLDELGFSHEIREQDGGQPVRVFIRRRDDA